MSEALRQTIDRGDYEVNPEAVALAMIGRARALRAARRDALCSEVLIPVESIEIRRLRSIEVDVCSLEGAA